MQIRPHVANGPRMETVTGVCRLVHRRNSIYESLDHLVPHGFAQDSHRHKSQLVGHVRKRTTKDSRFNPYRDFGYFAEQECRGSPGTEPRFDLNCNYLGIGDHSGLRVSPHDGKKAMTRYAVDALIPLAVGGDDQ